MAECPREALRDPTLPAGAKVVLTALWRYAGRQKRFVWPSADTLAADVGLKDRTVRKHLKVLRDRKWITNAESENGRRGWNLCDPPGAIVSTGVVAPQGEHDRDEDEAQACRESARTDREEAQVCRHEQTEVHERAADSAQTCQPHLYTNQRIEPTTSSDGGCTVQSAGPNIRAGAASGSGLRASTFVAEFAWHWRQAFGSGSGPRVENPTRGSRRLAGLQDVLDEHEDPDLVRDVLLHAGREVQRHLESGGRANVGLAPGRLAVAFRSEAPSFGVLLDDWQRAQQRKRSSGRFAAAPRELDGVPLDDDDQRTWALAMGDEPERAVREAREAKATAAMAGEALSRLPGFGGPL